MDETLVLVMSDTHLRSGASSRLPGALWEAAEAADAILHAGDIVTAELVEELARFAPVHAVLGNNDDAGLAATLPETLTVVLGGVEVGMVHNSGARAGRGRRMLRQFPTAGIVVFGHSHDPVNEVGEGDQVLFNPGSPTQRRRQPVATYGLLCLGGGEILERSIVPLG